MGIPVFHDDQHGTAIVVGAAATNALRVVGKRFEDIKVVSTGGGAAGIACLNMHKPAKPYGMRSTRTQASAGLMRLTR